MYEGHGYIKLTQDDADKSDLFIALHEVGALKSFGKYTEVYMKSGRYSFYVQETPDQIFKKMDEVHDKLLAVAKDRFQRHNRTHGVQGYPINDPGAN